MFRALLCLAFCLLAVLTDLGPAVAGRGGLGLGWLAPDGSRGALAVPAPGTEPVAPDPMPEAPAPRSVIAIARPDPADVEAIAEAARGVALGAAFNADLLSRRRARAGESHRTLPWAPRFAGTGMVGLRDLIASVEAGAKGYDAIHLSARALPARPPTDLTIAEIQAWISATPGQQHAIGRYQFIPATLAMLVNRLGLPPSTRFTSALQDRLADELLADAGLAEFQTGQIGRADFMANLAAIWAGLPTPSGRSYYHGLAGNAAGMSWSDYDRQMTALFPVPQVFARGGRPGG